MTRNRIIQPDSVSSLPGCRAILVELKPFSIIQKSHDSENVRRPTRPDGLLSSHVMSGRRLSCVTDQSRSNSLIEVFERVFSSTRLTITAQ